MAYGCNFSKVVSILTKHMKLLPLQGARLIALIPRALPWARCFCPFRASGMYYPYVITQGNTLGICARYTPARPERAKALNPGYRVIGLPCSHGDTLRPNG